MREPKVNDHLEDFQIKTQHTTSMELSNMMHAAGVPLMMGQGQQIDRG